MPCSNIAACGLSCPDCDLFKLPTDKAVQDRMIPDFRARGWLKEDEGVDVIISKNMYCKGCNVDKKVFWSDGACTIVACCKDTKKFSHCAECAEFPCAKTAEFAAKGGKYKAAVDVLVDLKKQG